jgi:hypothetical protein
MPDIIFEEAMYPIYAEAIECLTTQFSISENELINELTFR